MRPLLVTLPHNDELGEGLATGLAVDRGVVDLRAFPDGETYVRSRSAVAGRHVVVAGSLHRPDVTLLPLLMVAATLRDLGAARIGLVTPYLAYMRQDARFLPGEGITSVYVGRLLSAAVDWLVTVDPHLHRHASLDAVYSIPSRVVAAAPAIAGWIGREVVRPLVVGPDAESAQWVSAVAALADAPHLVFDKVRRGDRDVEVSKPDLGRWKTHTPVVIDDVISTAQTMIATVHHLVAAALPPPICIGVHAVFAAGSEADLRAAGAVRVVTTGTIPHPTNAIDVTDGLIDAVRAFLDEA